MDKRDRSVYSALSRYFFCLNSFFFYRINIGRLGHLLLIITDETETTVKEIAVAVTERIWNFRFILFLRAKLKLQEIFTSNYTNNLTII